ncbi:D-alanyl-D-alanine carboxypeptidase [Paenibacillus hemerocallicola]|uniref:D-alanyl-D-alanine carboxypeptidase n=1 Tax=Paenibacillus hemerocallicola TaxID=1172614 RepID=A0A5C4SW58_9BACL|nr:D-alanyl-D-alanine carboxypeptidase family protein [Paenibacillus hemerocallicola]TNJ58659.1 D-alanyl-D-alanine carboxypeptidase [Paenibacillus hemerocallicola]
MKRLTFAALGIALCIFITGTSIGNTFASNARSWVVRSFGGDGLQLQAGHAFVMDAATGDVLYAKNDKQRAYPASTTKILTALIALEMGKPDELVTVGAEAQPEDPEESRAGLRAGQKLKLYDLVEAALLPSGNDAARTIAVHIARKSAGNPKLDIAQAQQQFAKLMNKRAKKAGATRSNFVNPSGLHDPEHYSTARDLALIAKAAMENERFRQAVQVTGYEASPVNAGGGAAAKLSLTNTNQLLQPGSAYYFKGATGIKTGFTDQAGYCLVSSVARDGKRIIAVVLRSTSKDVYPDAVMLLEHGLDKAATAG